MNRMIIDLLNLNVRDATNNWDLNIGLTLMAYRSAVQASTGYTPFFLLNKREMRLALNVIYRLPERDQSRTEYAIEVCKTFDQAYDVARDYLQLAHKRQKDYYDCRTRGKRFNQGESVWLHTPVLEKGVSPKFHEPWTKPFKVKKQLSDVTYEIQDRANKTSKVVHFDRMKRATVKPRMHKLSECEENLPQAVLRKKISQITLQFTDNLQNRSTQNLTPLNLKRRWKNKTLAQ